MAAMVDNLIMRRAIGYLIAGLLLIFIGAFMIVSPGKFLAIGTAMFAVYMIFDGGRSLYAFFRYTGISRGVRSAVVSKGIVNLLLGIAVIILTIASPDIVMTVLVYIVAADFLLTGLINLADFLVMRKAGLRLGLLGMESGLEIAIAALMFFFPMMMGSCAVSLAGAAIIAFGAIAVVSCFWSLRVASAMREAERRARSDIGRFDEV